MKNMRKISENGFIKRVVCHEKLNKESKHLYEGHTGLFHRVIYEFKL